MESPKPNPWPIAIILSHLLILTLGIIIGLYAPKFISRLESPTSGTTTPSPISNLATYQDPVYNFEFQYPISYTPQNIKGRARDSHNNIVLISLATPEGNSIDVSLDQTNFSIDYLKKYAPTGSEFSGLESQLIGNNVFSYYGPGGGGVCYPNQYFLNFNNKVLIFKFGKCEFDKTPSEAIKAIERQLLSSFNLIEKRIPWTEAEKLILDGQILSVGQRHSLLVYLTTTDGRHFTTQEPQIDEVFAVIKRCGTKCQGILKSTE